MSDLKSTWFIGLRYALGSRASRSVSFISAIAMTGIVLGVALLIVVLSVMNGFDRELRQRILHILPHITLYQAGGMYEWQSLRQSLLEFEGVKSVMPFVELQAMVYEHKQVQPAIIIGMGSRFSDAEGIGKHLKPDTLERFSEEPTAIAIGFQLAKSLNVGLGDAVTLIVPTVNAARNQPAIQRFQIIDVFNTQTEVDHNVILMDLTSAASLSLQDQAVSGLQIQVEDLFLATSLAASIQHNLSSDFFTDNWTRTHGNLYSAIQLSKKMVVLLVLLIVAIAVFNIVSTLVMFVVDKKKDIAILRTLGMTKAQIQDVFLVQGALIGIIGTVVGVALGCVSAWLLPGFASKVEFIFGVQFLRSDIYPVSFLPSSLNPYEVMCIALVAIIMSLLASFYPARLAARLEPASVLQSD